MTGSGQHELAWSGGEQFGIIFADFGIPSAAVFTDIDKQGLCCLFENVLFSPDVPVPRCLLYVYNLIEHAPSL